MSDFYGLDKIILPEPYLIRVSDTEYDSGGHLFQYIGLVVGDIEILVDTVYQETIMEDVADFKEKVNNYVNNPPDMIPPGTLTNPRP